MDSCWQSVPQTVRVKVLSLQASLLESIYVHSFFFPLAMQFLCPCNISALDWGNNLHASPTLCAGFGQRLLDAMQALPRRVEQSGVHSNAIIVDSRNVHCDWPAE